MQKMANAFKGLAFDKGIDDSLQAELYTESKI